MEFVRLLNLPEEQVRSALMERLKHTWGFPERLLVKEKALHQLPHLLGIEKIPRNRRVDLIAYHWEAGELRPLVLFECKFLRPNAQALQQLIGYNHWVQAPFIALVGEEHEGLFRIDTGKWVSMGGLQPYEALCQLSNK